MREVNKQKTKFQLALTFIHFLSAFRIFFNDFLGRRDYVWFEKKMLYLFCFKSQSGSRYEQFTLFSLLRNYAVYFIVAIFLHFLRFARPIYVRVVFLFFFCSQGRMVRKTDEWMSEWMNEKNAIFFFIILRKKEEKWNANLVFFFSSSLLLGVWCTVFLIERSTILCGCQFFVVVVCIFRFFC